MKIDEVKELLREMGFPDGFISDQTAFTLLALSDKQPRQKLLPGHAHLAEGARVHDILDFVREDMGRQVAENTRESYRKTSRGGHLRGSDHGQPARAAS